MWEINCNRLKVVKTAFLAAYAMILGAAFYYQIVGDQGIRVYENQKNYFELVVTEIIRARTASFSLRLLSLVAGFCALLLLMKLISHVLYLKREVSSDDEQ
jgi:hypothetical protein